MEGHTDDGVMWYSGLSLPKIVGISVLWLLRGGSSSQGGGTGYGMHAALPSNSDNFIVWHLPQTLPLALPHWLEPAPSTAIGGGRR